MYFWLKSYKRSTDKDRIQRYTHLMWVGLFSLCTTQFVFCPACRSSKTSSFQNFPLWYSYITYTASPLKREKRGYKKGQIIKQKTTGYSNILSAFTCNWTGWDLHPFLPVVCCLSPGVLGDLLDGWCAAAQRGTYGYPAVPFLVVYWTVLLHQLPMWKQP